VVVTTVEAWRVHDTGLVAVPSRFRRLGGQVRHHQGHGPAWPARVTLELGDGELRVDGPDGTVGVWSLVEVSGRRVAEGPPVSFVVDVPGASHLLAAAAGPAVEDLLAGLAGGPDT
jgi:hypothetical protein